VRAIRSQFLEGRVPGLQAGFGLAGVPVDRVLEQGASTDGAAAALSTSPDQRLGRLAPEVCATVRQVHGTRVVQVDPTTPPAELAVIEADALVSRHPRVALGARTADCVPLLLCEACGRGCAAVHAGWRGTVDGVVGTAVAALCELTGSRPAGLLAHVGPSIGACCFEVGDEVAERFRPDEVVRRPEWPRPHVDLQRAVLRQLLELGLPPAAVAPFCDDDAVPCTSCDAARFASYRRATRAGRPLEAYQFSVIMLGIGQTSS
jgi:YfiH family protein